MNGMKKFLALILFSFFAITMVACGATPIEGTPTGENFGSFGTYDNLKEYLLDYMKMKMEDTIHLMGC